MTEDRITKLEERVNQIEKAVRLIPLRLLAATSLAALVIIVILVFR